MSQAAIHRSEWYHPPFEVTQLSGPGDGIQFALDPHSHRELGKGRIAVDELEAI